MTINLDPYKKALAATRSEVVAALAGGFAAPSTIAVLRLTADLMADDLANRPQSLAWFENTRNGQLTGPDLWRYMNQLTAGKRINPQEVTPELFAAKNAEYTRTIEAIRNQHQVPTELFKDKQRKVAYLVQENDKVREALADIAYAFKVWAVVRSSDPDFPTTSAPDALHRMLSERQDLLTALRVAQRLPKDVNTFPLPAEQRPMIVEVVEFGVACIPVVGTAVAILEATIGYDLFGYELDPLDRAIIAGGAILPFAGRFVKGGRALYTAARLERLYGQQAARWSLAIAAGEKVSADVAGRKALSKANAMVRAGRKVDAALAAEVAETLGKMGVKRGTPRSVLHKYVSDALNALIKNKPILAELDELALARVAAKGPSINAMKGQLLEEFLEARIASWLRNPAGAAALGIPHPPPGHTLEFIPGHLIRDTSNRQLTDGIIAFRKNGELHVVAIFEAKAGKSAARELKSTSSGIKSLTVEERHELRAYARDVYEEAAEEARLAGKPLSNKAGDIEAAIEKIERDIVQSEHGGQVRRDIERMSLNDTSKPTFIRVGSDTFSVHVSPQRTKIFGVVPHDVHVGDMVQQVQDLGYKFEVLGMNIKQKDLIDLATGLLAAVP